MFRVFVSRLCDWLPLQMSLPMLCVRSPFVRVDIHMYKCASFIWRGFVGVYSLYLHFIPPDSRLHSNERSSGVSAFQHPAPPLELPASQRGDLVEQRKKMRCVCVYIYMYVPVSVCVCIHEYFTCVHVYIYTYMCVCVCVCVSSQFTANSKAVLAFTQRSLMFMCRMRVWWTCPWCPLRIRGI